LAEIDNFGQTLSVTAEQAVKTIKAEYEKYLNSFVEEQD